MINVAVCDDDVSVLREFRTLFQKYCEAGDIQYNYKSFQNPLDLTAEIEKGARFDIIFLDVLMPGENGIIAAGEIRRYDKNVKIVFLTSSAEYAVQSYSVNAYYYQLKPLDEESLFRLLDNALAECKKEKENSIILRCKNGITRIEIDQFEYCEVIHRTLYIHLTNGHVLECNGSLDDLNRQLLQFGCFLRVHRSYLVNMDYMHNLSYRAVTMSCLAEIPVPRGKFNEIKNKFLEYSFQRKQVML